jgi:hypothetical protein
VTLKDSGDLLAVYGAMLDQCIGDRQHGSGLTDKQRASFGAGTVDIAVDVANFPNNQRSDASGSFDIVTGAGKRRFTAKYFFRHDAGQPSDAMRMRLLKLTIERAGHQLFQRGADAFDGVGIRLKSSVIAPNAPIVPVDKFNCRSDDRQEHVRCNGVPRFVNRKLAIETAAIKQSQSPPSRRARPAQKIQ